MGLARRVLTLIDGACYRGSMRLLGLLPLGAALGACAASGPPDARTAAAGASLPAAEEARARAQRRRRRWPAGP